MTAGVKGHCEVRSAESICLKRLTYLVLNCVDPSQSSPNEAPSRSMASRRDWYSARKSQHLLRREEA